MKPHKDTSPSTHVWEELLSGLKTGKSGNETAVHKPLLVLMILEQAQRGGLNRFAFEDLAGSLDEAIQRFGAAQRPGGSEMPFWHLKNDGFWIVKDEDSLPRRSSGDRPTKTGLLEHKAEASVRPDLWEQLVSDPQLIERLAVQLLTAYWSVLEHAAILKHIGLNISPEMLARRGMVR